jgi:hypothetical protein
LDYHSVNVNGFQKQLNENLIIVNATHRSRLKEAVTVIRRLNDAGVPFAAVGFSSREMKTIRRLSDERCIFLPKVEDDLQALVDLPFYYLFAFYFGMAHGRSASEFPRNRAKSLTAGRSRSQQPLSHVTLCSRLRSRRPDLKPSARAADSIGPSLWEREINEPTSVSKFKQLRHLADRIEKYSTVDALVDVHGGIDKHLIETFRKAVEDGRRIILVPTDRYADAAARAAAHVWGPYTGVDLEVLSGIKQELRIKEAFSIAISSKAASADNLRLRHYPYDLFVSNLASINATTKAAWQPLYAGLIRLLIHMWYTVETAPSEILDAHLVDGIRIIRELLDNGQVLRDIQTAVAANRDYKTATLITPFRATGMDWESKFDEAGRLIVNWRLIGELVHGSVVTIDSAVAEKYVEIDGKPTADQVRRAVGPFFADGRWYLPKLKANYDPRSDNLIVFDASSENHRSQIMDEFSSLGCRYPRLVVITQPCLWKPNIQKAFSDFPISHLIELPNASTSSSAYPISDVHLPLVLNAVITAMNAVFQTQARDHDS